MYDLEAAGCNLRTCLEGREGCSSSVAAAVCPTEPPARPEGERIMMFFYNTTSMAWSLLADNVAALLSKVVILYKYGSLATK